MSAVAGDVPCFFVHYGSKDESVKNAELSVKKGCVAWSTHPHPEVPVGTHVLVRARDQRDQVYYAGRIRERMSAHELAGENVWHRSYDDGVWTDGAMIAPISVGDLASACGGFEGVRTAGDVHNKLFGGQHGKKYVKAMPREVFERIMTHFRSNAVKVPQPCDAGNDGDADVKLSDESASPEASTLHAGTSTASDAGAVQARARANAVHAHASKRERQSECVAAGVPQPEPVDRSPPNQHVACIVTGSTAVEALESVRIALSIGGYPAETAVWMCVDLAKLYNARLWRILRSGEIALDDALLRDRRYRALHGQPVNLPTALLDQLVVDNNSSSPTDEVEERPAQRHQRS